MGYWAAGHGLIYRTMSLGNHGVFHLDLFVYLWVAIVDDIWDTLVKPLVILVILGKIAYEMLLYKSI